MQYNIRFDNGAQFTCSAETAVAQAMKQAGVRATVIGCRGGGCGVCRVRVLEGEYLTSPMSREHVSEAEQEAGYALGCCLFPRSDLVLSVSPKGNQQAIGAPGSRTDKSRPYLRLV